MTTTMTAVLVDYSYQLRIGSNDASKRGKRLRRTVGKSISTDDLEEQSFKQLKMRISDSEEEEDLLEVEEQSINTDDYEIGESSIE